MTVPHGPHGLRVRVTVLRGTGGQAFRLREETPPQAMPEFHAVGIRLDHQ